MIKNILIAFGFSMLILNSTAQVPQLVNYQGVARDNNGVELANQTIGLQITVHSGSPNGTSVYEETHTTTTNQFGLFTVQIGGGTIVSGTFNTINWGTGSYYAEAGLDASGGSNYQSMGTSQLLSVPYALYAQTSGSSLPGPQGAPGESGCDIISVGDMVVVYTDEYAYGFSQTQTANSNDQGYPDDNTGQWTSIALDDSIIGTDASEKQIVLYTATSAYGFSQNQSAFSTEYYPDDDAGTWTSVALSGTPLGSYHSQKQVVVYTTTNAYGFAQTQTANSNAQGLPEDNAGQWISVALTGTPLGGKASSKNIVIYTTTNAYGFSQNQSSFSTQYYPDDDAGQWITTTLTGTPKGIVNTK